MKEYGLKEFCRQYKEIRRMQKELEEIMEKERKWYEEYQRKSKSRREECV